MELVFFHLRQMFSDSSWWASHWIEVVGTITGLIYLWSEIKQKLYGWFFWVASSLMYVFVYAVDHNYANAVYSVYNVIIGIYGYLSWRKNKTTTQAEIVYQYIDIHLFIKYMFALVIMCIGMYYLLDYLEGGNPLFDALTVSISIIAALMLAKQYIETWWLWLGVNILYTYLFWIQCRIPSMLMFAIYSIGAVYGLVHWKRVGKHIDHAKS